MALSPIRRHSATGVGCLGAATPLVAAGLLVAASVLGWLVPRPLAAQEASASSDDRWEFLVVPYLLFPYMNGTTTVGIVEIDVDADPGDIFSDLQFGFMLLFEAHNPVWAVSLDGLYMNLEQTGQLGLGQAGLKQGMVQLTGFRRVLPWLEVLAGGRLNVMEAEIELFPGGGLPTISADRSKSWFDPFIGARAAASSGKWLFVFRGDIGGFGIGSNIAWQIYPSVSYRFSELFGLGVAYRVLGMDYESGSGTDFFQYDVTTFGPEIGLLFHF